MDHLPETKMIPPMPYVSDFNKDEMKTVKLKHVTGLVSKEKKVPIFDTKTGIEGLLFCEETARKAFRYLGVSEGGDMFNLYEETLAGNAVRKWNNVIANIPVANRTPAQFNAAMKLYYKHFVDDKSRNTMYEYLKTRDCGKPFKSSVYDHVDRMEELYRYSSRLPGTIPELDDSDPDDANQIKELIYVTFPNQWQEAFEDVHDVETTSQAEINKFMNRQKAKELKRKKKKVEKKPNKTDSENNAKTKKDPPGKWKGNKNGNNNNKKTKKGLSNDDPCPIHGGHKWGACFDNKYGPNFRPPRQGNDRGNDNRRQGKEMAMVYPILTTVDQQEAALAQQEDEQGDGEESVVVVEPTAPSALDPAQQLTQAAPETIQQLVPPEVTPGLATTTRHTVSFMNQGGQGRVLQTAGAPVPSPAPTPSFGFPPPSTYPPTAGGGGLTMQTVRDLNFPPQPPNQSVPPVLRDLALLCALMLGCVAA